MNVWFDLGII